MDFEILKNYANYFPRSNAEIVVRKFNALYAHKRRIKNASNANRRFKQFKHSTFLHPANANANANTTNNNNNNKVTLKERNELNWSFFFIYFLFI